MKSIKIFMITLLLIVSQMGQSQFSIKLGGTAASLSTKGQTLLKTSARADYLIGVHYQFFFSDVVGIEPGIMYQNLTTRFSIPGASFDLKRDYIAIPVLVKIFPNSLFSFGGGLQASFLAHDNFEDNFKNDQFTVSGQLQVTLNPTPQFGLELGYNYGFVPYVTFNNREFNGISFKEGDGRNKFYYLAFIVNLRK